MIRRLACSAATSPVLFFALGIVFVHALPGEPTFWRLAVVALAAGFFGAGVVWGRRQVDVLLTRLATAEAAADRDGWAAR